MTIRTLKKLTKEWAELLQLNGWEITPSFVEKTETEDAYGETTWSTEWKKAVVHMERPEVIEEDGITTFERVLVHELLHIALEGHKPPSAEYDASYERALNILSELLVKLKPSLKSSKKKNVRA